MDAIPLFVTAAIAITSTDYYGALDDVINGGVVVDDNGNAVQPSF